MKGNMNGLLQTTITIFVGVSFLMLLGCPKKIAPTKKAPRVARPAPSLRPPKPPIPTTPLPPTPMVEEEIPRIATLEEFDAPPLNKQGDQDAASSMKDIFFDLDQWVPRSDNLETIQKNVNWLIAHPKATVRLEGHGDNRGTNEYNLVLGEKRANSVKAAMVTMGVKASKITAVSYGEERPFCAQDNTVCFQENRRVHYRVE